MQSVAHTSQPLSELDILKMKMNEKTDQSLQATKNMVKMCAESQEVGAATLNNLQEQGEQLRKIDRNLDDMHEDLSSAQKNLDELDKCCGLCILPWKRSKKHTAYKYPTKTDYATNGKSGAIMKNANNNNVNGFQQQQQQPNGGFINRITNDAREDEMEQNLQQVSCMVSQLQNMATEMGEELNTQNQVIDRVAVKTDLNKRQLDDAQQKADAILGSSANKPTKDQSILPSSNDPKWMAAKMMMK